jgi:glycosyltransferase involved in cell wall biosynthesis
MKKIKILMVPSDTQGVGHFRNIWPAQSLTKHFGDEFEVEINAQPNFQNLEYLKSFNIIHFHRHLGPYEGMQELFKQLKEFGVVLIMDIDDYWEPPTTHPLFELVRKEKLTEKIIDTLKIADYVTTTTEVFANYIRKYNKNVQVIPNALDMTDKMWKSSSVDNNSDRCRIAWIGGSSHHHDLKLLEHSMKSLYGNKELEDKFQIVMCGFDTRGTITEIMPNGQRNTRNIQPHETIWLKFEEIFTANYHEKNKDEEYFKWLSKIKREDYPGLENKSYVRRWTLPLTQYAKHYDYCDVCLAPLEDVEYYKTEKGQVIKRNHYFNEVKSELKIIEAGMKKKALIAQNFGAYKSLIENGKTGILVDDNKDGWYKAMKKVIQDPDYRNELANNLHEFVKDRYELKNVTANRAEFYKNVLVKKTSPEAILEGLIQKAAQETQNRPY